MLTCMLFMSCDINKLSILMFVPIHFHYKYLIVTQMFAFLMKVPEIFLKSKFASLKYAEILAYLIFV